MQYEILQLLLPKTRTKCQKIKISVAESLSNIYVKFEVHVIKKLKNGLPLAKRVCYAPDLGKFW